MFTFGVILIAVTTFVVVIVILVIIIIIIIIIISITGSALNSKFLTGPSQQLNQKRKETSPVSPQWIQTFISM